MAKSYNIQAADQVLQHADGALLFVQDLEGRNIDLDVLAASGDAFVTLATRLDAVCQTLPEPEGLEHLEIERIIKALLYLQMHYRLSRKSDPTRPTV